MNRKLRYRVTSLAACCALLTGFPSPSVAEARALTASGPSAKLDSAAVAVVFETFSDELEDELARMLIFGLVSAATKHDLSYGAFFRIADVMLKALERGSLTASDAAAIDVHLPSTVETLASFAGVSIKEAGRLIRSGQVTAKPALEQITTGWRFRYESPAASRLFAEALKLFTAARQ